MPQVTIQMVLPQKELTKEWTEESEEEPVEESEEEQDEMEEHDEDESEVKDEFDLLLGTVTVDPVPDPMIMAVPPTSTTTTAPPACVNYITIMSMGPCPTYSRLPTNSEGCAVATSTTLALTTLTASATDPTYSYSIGHGHGRGHRYRKNLDKLPPLPISPSIEVFPADKVEQRQDIPENQKDFDIPATITTAFQTSYSAHYSYTLSFDFTYGVTTPSPVPGTSLPELPAPTAMLTSKATATATPTSDTTPVADTPPTPTNPATPPLTVPADPTTLDQLQIEPPASVDPQDPAIHESRLEDLSAPLAPDERQPDTKVVTKPGPALVTQEEIPEIPEKACQECPEPCVVELNVAAKAEVPLLAKLFEDKIKKALASLKLTLENESGSRSGQDKDDNDNDNDNDESVISTGLFTGLNVDIHTAGLFRKTCEDKLESIESKHIEALNEKWTAASFEARSFKSSRRDMTNNNHKRRRSKVTVDAKVDVEKRGLLDGILGEDNVVESMVDGLGDAVDKIVAKTVTPMTGSDVVELLVDGLTGTVKSVVDSFVGNCNRKGLLDIDTEKGVGTLAAITNVSLNLFKI
ncbi:hypothetical protein BGX23_004551, partial [Mortierella sp. AD031]